MFERPEVSKTGSAASPNTQIATKSYLFNIRKSQSTDVVLTATNIVRAIFFMACIDLIASSKDNN